MNLATLRVGALELPYRHGDVGGVLDDLRSALGQAGRLDLVALGECAFTGYVSPRGDFDLRRFAEGLEGPTVAAVSRLAREHSVALGFPLVEAAGDRHFNSYLVVDAQGAIVAHYRKRHPWYPEAWATPGDLGTPTFALGGFTFTLAVCFDIHFVADEAAESLALADALLFPSAWVDDDSGDARTAILGDLARDHGLWVVNPNWGTDAPVRYGTGRSRIVAPDGRAAVIAPRVGGLAIARLTGGRGRRET